jgi:hypothetical protein
MDTQGNLFNFYLDTDGQRKITPVGNVGELRQFKVNEIAGGRRMPRPAAHPGTAHRARRSAQAGARTAPLALVVTPRRVPAAARACRHQAGQGRQRGGVRGRHPDTPPPRRRAIRQGRQRGCRPPGPPSLACCAALRAPACLCGCPPAPPTHPLASCWLLQFVPPGELVEGLSMEEGGPLSNLFGDGRNFPLNRYEVDLEDEASLQDQIFSQVWEGAGRPRGGGGGGGVAAPSWRGAGCGA